MAASFAVTKNGGNTYKTECCSYELDGPMRVLRWWKHWSKPSLGPLFVLLRIPLSKRTADDDENYADQNCNKISEMVQYLDPLSQDAQRSHANMSYPDSLRPTLNIAIWSPGVPMQNWIEFTALSVIGGRSGFAPLTPADATPTIRCSQSVSRIHRAHPLDRKEERGCRFPQAQGRTRRRIDGYFLHMLQSHPHWR